ncbi:PepSY domain-containing protein [Leptothermofonsia sichuanensis E412]|uniref:PepSY domain-containing protein n=1 Tax=Leptothermofonsia sichuanensis TaxID=2917832 RepID=UPI001CA60281|nr:PepSY domain-containing protein [Leptothermofonsia sichuanensis E412]
MNIFKKVHDGTFAGFPTRILYLLIGITPLMLLATGFFMYGYRRPGTLKSPMVAHNTVTHHLNLPPVDRVAGN